METRIAITGVAMRSALGATFEAHGEGARCGLTRVHPYRHLLDAPLGVIADLSAGPNRAFDLARTLAASLRPLEHYAPHEVGLFLGTTTSGIESWFNRQSPPWSPSPALLLDPQYELGAVAPFLKRHLGITGPAFVYATACSASAVALAKARDAIRMGLVKAAVAGGFDVLTPMTIMGFDCLQILDHDVCRPFHPERKGLNLAEGGALFTLETPARARADQTLAYLVGAGAASDAYHMTHPEPEGRGMELAMRRALADAGLEPRDVDYLNAHGTGTIPNDHTEKLAIDRIFAEGGVTFESTKRLHGHTLGGAGALEAAVSLALMHEMRLEHVLSNSFGFGGNDASLVFAAPP